MHIKTAASIRQKAFCKLELTDFCFALMKQPMQAPGLWERGYNQKQTKKNNLIRLFTVPYSSPAP